MSAEHNANNTCGPQCNWFVVISENLLPSFCMVNPDVYNTIASDNFIGIHVFELFHLNIFNICVYMKELVNNTYQ